MQILVVDSDLQAAARLSEAITEFAPEYEVLNACSGLEGVKKIENGMVNIVLAAEKLVDMTGATFIHILRSLKELNKKEPACVLMADNKTRVKTAEVGCPASFDVIRWPVNPDELLYVLDRAIDLDGLNGKIEFNEFIWRVLLLLVPVAIVIGIVVRSWT